MSDNPKWQKARLTKARLPELIGRTFWVESATLDRTTEIIEREGVGLERSPSALLRTNLNLRGGPMWIPTVFIELMPEFAEVVAMELEQEWRERGEA